TSQALFYYCVGMIGYAIREVLNRTFYSLQDSKTPMFNAALAVVLNIVLNFVLSHYMGLKGLALATSISALFCSFLLALNLRKKIGPFGIKDNVITFLKVIFASCVMGIVIYAIEKYTLISWNPLLKMSAIIITGGLIYFLLITTLKVKESKLLIQFIRRKIHL
ncbi:MAG: lipid II flippase MurJ, partial [Psychrobacillus psychrodurans]